MVRIGIDMDNGDETSEGSVADRISKGLTRFLNDYPNTEVSLYGSEEKIKSVFNGQSGFFRIIPSTVFYTQSNAITRPVEGTSLYNMVSDIDEKKIDGFFSIGDTSKIGIESVRIRDKKLSQALMAVFPTIRKQEFICSDVGYSNQSFKKPKYFDVVFDGSENTYKQGIMAVHTAMLNGIDKPRFGILSNGTEAHKGNDFDRCLEQMVQEALTKTPLGNSTKYLGKIESSDCFRDKVDIVFSDGYKGNLFLKSCEATIFAAKEMVSEEFKNLPWYHKGALILAAPALKRIKRNLVSRFDPDKYSGALLIGFDGVVVEGHGASTPTAIYNGICRLRGCAGEDFTNGMEQAVLKYTPQFDKDKILTGVFSKWYNPNSDKQKIA